MMKKAVFFLFIFFAGASLQLYAEEAAAVVIYGDGYSFSLSRNGSESYYDVVYDDVVGMDLYAGDYISTDGGTFLEIQLTSSENVLKISENTSFQITSVSGRGGGAFDLTYGRVRGKVAKLFGEDEFRIRGQSVVAGVRGTDFGFDIIAGRFDEGEDAVEFGGTGTIAQIYCFDGRVEVAKTELPEESVTIEANQMIRISLDKVPETVEFRPRDVTEEISQYWSVNDFMGELIDFQRDSEEEEPQKTEPAEDKSKESEASAEKEKPEQLPEEEVQIFTDEEMKRRAAIRNGFLTAGTSLVSIGALAEITALVFTAFGDRIFHGSSFDYGYAADILTYTGAGIIVGGMFTYIGAAFFK